MSFLFAELPPKNYQMTEKQLTLWQRNAVFECECDNLINQTIEAHDRQNRWRTRQRRRMDISAINAAISSHGLSSPRLNSSHHNARRQSLPLSQNTRIQETDDDRTLIEVVLEGAYNTAVHHMGLNLPSDP